MKRIPVIIENRYATAADWVTLNPILKCGDLAVESDTGLTKIGNGVDAWNNLSYSVDSQYKIESYRSGRTLDEISSNNNSKQKNGNGYIELNFNFPVKEVRINEEGITSFMINENGVEDDSLLFRKKVYLFVNGNF
jgi:hypothetical protein